jgi:hypothetical protein
MQTHNATGVPALMVSNEQGRRLLHGEVIYGHVDQLLDEILS